MLGFSTLKEAETPSFSICSSWTGWWVRSSGWCRINIDAQLKSPNARQCRRLLPGSCPEAPSYSWSSGTKADELLGQLSLVAWSTLWQHFKIQQFQNWIVSTKSSIVFVLTLILAWMTLKGLNLKLTLINKSLREERQRGASKQCPTYLDQHFWGLKRSTSPITVYGLISGICIVF